jgi:hypothetical protein
MDAHGVDELVQAELQNLLALFFAPGVVQAIQQIGQILVLPVHLLNPDGIQIQPSHQSHARCCSPVNLANSVKSSYQGSKNIIKV